jgi:hypothetical protein
MFLPNGSCTLRRKAGRDKFGQAKLSDPVTISYAPVDMNMTVEKTSVRSDSSATRGQAEQLVSANAKILVPAKTVVGAGDQLEIDGENYRVSGRHARKNVFGNVDHIELLLEVFPA